MTSEDVVRQFLDAINEADASRLGELMTDEHVFIDSDGTVTCGRAVMQEAWPRFFGMMPDYRVEIRETFCRENTVVLVGVATGGESGGPVRGLVGPGGVARTGGGRPGRQLAGLREPGAHGGGARR